MKFEELQTIWETQRQRPVFSANEFGMQVALYRSRERTRRRQFWGGVFPLFAASSLILLFLAVPLLEVLVFQGPVDRLPPDELAMTGWDALACLCGMALAAFSSWTIYSNRRRSERLQKVFAPSLRQEIALGIARLDTEVSMISGGVVWRAAAAIIAASMIMSWEVGRLNDDPTPWSSVGLVVPVLAWIFLGRASARQRSVELRQQRKKALEELRAKLDDTPAEA